MKYDEISITVRFSEIDAYNVAWHGNYVNWMEMGRIALASRFGLDPFQLSQAGFMGPVISLEIKYLRPARYNDELIVKTTLRNTPTATLEFISEIVDANGTKLATGRTVHALTDNAGVLQYQLPQAIAERIQRMTDWLGEQ
ncbi:MAG TPA: acyl-CoA thioesterase [Deltaproteobacteria bacterium]|nr:acyl-CoA thioesterase [Deltaproteobacteria bacterium]HQB37726.1 acyl-CoA thioesterase [Deltaproteobacteria bacterium]